MKRNYKLPAKVVSKLLTLPVQYGADLSRNTTYLWGVVESYLGRVDNLKNKYGLSAELDKWTDNQIRYFEHVVVQLTTLIALMEMKKLKRKTCIVLVEHIDTEAINRFEGEEIQTALLELGQAVEDNRVDIDNDDVPQWLFANEMFNCFDIYSPNIYRQPIRMLFGNE